VGTGDLDLRGEETLGLLLEVGLDGGAMFPDEPVGGAAGPAFATISARDPMSCTGAAA
jgi:hypothetical protein